LIPHQNIENSAENEGYRLVKWQPDPAWVGNSGNNDVATIRYAEILLTKAEAIIRSGGDAAEALDLVNQVRKRSNATELSSLALNTILDERGRELMFEGTRRRDMIRFGTFFTGTWKYKTTVTPEYRKILPIPITELNANPSLTQNPGYQ
jgi:starch-binding outer membrane protein, SusD/RagB family